MTSKFAGKCRPLVGRWRLPSHCPRKPGDVDALFLVSRKTKSEIANLL